MDISKLDSMTEDELEQLDTDARHEERTMLTNLNMFDEKIGKLDRELVMKDLELRDLKKTKTMLNRNLRLLTSEQNMILKYLWKIRKNR
jgi:hypothetical protein